MGQLRWGEWFDFGGRISDFEGRELYPISDLGFRISEEGHLLEIWEDARSLKKKGEKEDFGISLFLL
jgi:hypothetical protein